uniref:Uncharacterized protein n=1 Tax=Parascaris equorum TaxID=6256 RepID=A0A914RUB3_PAREQ
MDDEAWATGLDHITIYSQQIKYGKQRMTLAELGIRRYNRRDQVTWDRHSFCWVHIQYTGLYMISQCI